MIWWHNSEWASTIEDFSNTRIVSFPTSYLSSAWYIDGREWFGCVLFIVTFAYGARKSRAVMCRRNFLVFVNFPKHVPTDMSLSREKLVASFKIFSLWTENQTP